MDNTPASGTSPPPSNRQSRGEERERGDGEAVVREMCDGITLGEREEGEP